MINRDKQPMRRTVWSDVGGFGSSYLPSAGLLSPRFAAIIVSRSVVAVERRMWCGGSESAAA
jgi:hypothetical protein